MRLIRTALATAVVALAVTAAAAQSGGITVIVTDAEGAQLPGATVTISHETGFVKTTAQLSNKDGVADFPVLRPGAGYAIQVTFPGFSPIRQDALRVRINSTLTLPVQMIEEFQERVKVTAERDVIDLETSETATKFSENFIADLPVPGRFYQNVLTMAPGVQDADGDGNPNVHGSRSRDFQAVVSGVSNVDPLTGQWMSNVNPNSIEEMEVVTAGAGVEFGRAQGGFTRIIQKQGSNNFEGVAEFYWRSSKLDSDGAADFNATQEPDFDWIQPSIQVSGPLIPDKLWYRASLESRDIDDPVNTNLGIEVFTREEKTYDGQLTWQVSPRNKLALQYRADPRDWSGAGLSSTVPLESSRALSWSGQTTSLTWTAPYSPKVLVESTVAWQDLNFERFPTEAGAQNSCLSAVAPETEFLNGAFCFDTQTNSASGSYFRIDDDHRQRLSVKGQATVYGGRFWGMNHQFKLGISVENERYFRDLARNPQVTYFVFNDPGDDPTDPNSEPQSYGIALTRLAIPQTDEVRATGTNWAFYAEDQFKPRQNLTITLGARIDREEISSDGRQVLNPINEYNDYIEALGGQDDTGNVWPLAFTGFEDFASYTAELQAITCNGVPAEEIGNCLQKVSESVLKSDQDQLVNKRRADSLTLANTNVSPFLSVAWSPWSNGKTAIKASAGRHYNNIPLVVPLQELEPILTDLAYRINFGSTDDEGDSDPGVPQLLGAVSPTVNLSSVSRSLKTPYQDEFTLAFERELWAETSLHLTYINRKFRDQIQDTNVNVTTGDFGRCIPDTPGGGSPIEESPGTGPLVDPFTGETYFDNVPGIGDGILDDCVGEIENIDVDPEAQSGGPGESNVDVLEGPDDVLDLYTQNPFWGDVYVIGNINEIDYEAYVLELVRRQYRSWEMNASYTWSEAKGDGEDFFQELGDDPSLRDNISGFQSYDQRHVVKLNATTITPWGVRLGTSVSWQSGLPYSVLDQQLSVDSTPPGVVVGPSTSSRVRQRYVTGQRNDQRNNSYWNVDLKATKELNMGRGLNLQISAEVFNALNDGTYIVYNPFLERGVQVNGTNEAVRRFGRRWQLGAKISF